MNTSKKKKMIGFMADQNQIDTITDYCKSEKITKVEYIRSALRLMESFEANGPEITLIGSEAAEVRRRNKAKLNKKDYAKLNTCFDQIMKLMRKEDE